jgi:hypothetical protein
MSLSIRKTMQSVLDCNYFLFIRIWFKFSMNEAGERTGESVALFKSLTCPHSLAKRHFPVPLPPRTALPQGQVSLPDFFPPFGTPKFPVALFNIYRFQNRVHVFLYLYRSAIHFSVVLGQFALL